MQEAKHVVGCILCYNLLFNRFGDKDPDVRRGLVKDLKKKMLKRDCQPPEGIVLPRILAACAKAGGKKK